MLRKPTRALLCLALTPWLVAAGEPEPSAAGGPGSAVEVLTAKFRAIEAQLNASDSQEPIYLESEHRDGRMQGDIYGVIDHPFEDVSRALTVPANWCDIVPLHLNVKACTHRMQGGTDRLTVYSGRKFYQPPEQTHQLDYRYRLQEFSEDYFKLSLRADEGPLGTHDYLLELAAIPLEGDRTFLHVCFAYEYGLPTRLAISGYLATMARKKVGFSVSGLDGNGQPILVNGLEGAIERNSVRYHLAVQAYLDTLELAENDRFESRLNRWFDLTERHHRQLFELEKDQYLDFKRRERSDQLRLQGTLNAAGAGAFGG